MNNIGELQGEKLEELKSSMAPEKAVLQPKTEKAVLTEVQAAIPKDPAPEQDPAPEGGKRMDGKVVFYNKAKGFGFADTEAGRVFIHHNSMDSKTAKKLEPGTRVRMEVVPDKGRSNPSASKCELA